MILNRDRNYENNITQNEMCILPEEDDKDSLVVVVVVV
jgi:hypothetical protein